MMRFSRQFFCFVVTLVAVLGCDGLCAESKPAVPPVLQPFVDRHEVGGIVTLVATKDKILEQSAVGFMDLATRTPLRTDALFWIASQSKPIVATAMMMMIDEGKVSLDDPVTQYIPEFKEQWLIAEHDEKHTLLKKPEHPILIRHLLSHTSGMLYKTVIEQPTLDILPLEARMHNYVMSPLQFEPGAKHLYANAGINTAARIVEIVSGKSYPDFIQERIFNPLRMKDTTFWPTEEQLKRLAKPYAPDPDKKGALAEVPNPQLRPPYSDHTRFVQPAGGLFSTAADLLNFYRMLLGNGTFEGKRLLSEKAIQQMTSKQTGSLKQNYGFGLDVTPGKIGHGGTLGTLSAMDREHGIISIFMVQYGGPGAVLNKCRQAFQKAVQERYWGKQTQTATPVEIRSATPTVTSVEAFTSLAPLAEWTEKWPNEHGGQFIRQVRAQIWNAAIEAALDQGGSVLLPHRPVPYYLDGPIILKSGQRLVAAPDAEIRLKPNSNTCMVRNASMVSGQKGPVSNAMPTDQNISIQGGIWTTLAFDRESNGNNVGRSSTKNEHPGSYAVIVLSNVKNVVVKDLVIRRSRPFGVQMSQCTNFHIANIRFEEHLRDGIHINGPAHQGVIEGISGVTHDDFVALNAWDWKGSAITFGPITGVAVRDIRGSDSPGESSAPAGSREIRLQAGTKNFENNQKVDCNIEDCVFQDIRGIRTVKMYDQPNLEMGRDKDFADPIGKMRHILFKDLVVEQPSDPAMFQVGSNVDGLDIEEVKLDFEPTPDFRLVSVGPLSQTYKHHKDDPKTWVEIFSPDKDCTLQHLKIGRVQSKTGALEGRSLVKVIQQTINPDYPHSTPRGGTGKGIWEDSTK